MKLLLFCEAPSDFQTANALVNRVLGEEGPPWVADLFPEHPEAVRQWIEDAVPGRAFFDIHRIDEYKRRFRDVRFPQGHFDGKPGAPGAQMARNAFLIARQMAKKPPAPVEVDAVFLVWDMDDQGEARREGLKQAREEASRWAPFRIVFGCPDRMREAWALAGFDAESDEERARLDEARRELGFSPCDEAHRLDAKDEQAKASPKRVLRSLTGGDREREARCSTDAPLARLRERGAGSGLQAFLDEVKERVVPLCSKAP